MTLILHSGAEPVTYEQVQAVIPPNATETHSPLPHTFLIDTLQDELDAAKVQVTEEAFGMTKEGDRFFGLMEVKHDDLRNGEMSTLIGLRNSHDKVFQAEIAIGSRVFVCDNLSFYGEHVLGRRHSGEIEIYIRALIKVAVEQLFTTSAAFMETMDRFKDRTISIEEGDNLIVQAARKRILGKSLIYKTADILRNSEDRYGEYLSLWRLYNSFTESMKPKSQSAMEALPGRTIRLLKHLETAEKRGSV